MTLPAALEGGSHKATNLPWLTGYEYDSFIDSPGGYCIPFKAGAELKVGDYVYLSAAHTVNKSASAGDYTSKAVGVVVGGQALYHYIVQGDQDVGEIAAATGQIVMVCVLGRAKVIAGAAFSLGAALSGGTATAGRVEATVGGRLLAMEAAANAGDIVLALVIANAAADAGAQPSNANLTLLAGAATAVTGARDEPEGALANLLTALAAKGIIVDSTTAS